MKYNPGHIDLSGLPRAIDFEAQVARNREIIKALPEPTKSVLDEEPASAGFIEDFTFAEVLEIVDFGVSEG